MRSLESIPVTPTNHFRLHFHAAVFALIDHLRARTESGDVTDVLRRYPFLAGYMESIVQLVGADLTWSEVTRWWPTAITAWEGTDRQARLPLRSLGDLPAIGFTGRLQLICAGLVEEDSRFGQLFAEVLGRPVRRPTVETLAALTAPTDDVRIELAGPGETAAVARKLVALGVLTVPNEDDPRSDWIAQLPPELWEIIVGAERPLCPPWMSIEPIESLPPLDRLVAPKAVVAAACAVPRLISDRAVDTLVVRGSKGSDRLALVGAIAEAVNRPVLRVEAAKAPAGFADRLGPVAVALGALPVVVFDLGPGETAPPLRFRAYDGPAVVIMTETGGIEPTASDRTVTIEFPFLPVTQRRQRWSAAFAGTEVEDVDAIAHQIRLQGGHIDQAAVGAVAVAALDGGGPVAVHHVRAAARQLNRQLLDSLATHIDGGGGWSELVVGDFTMAKLLELESRCRHREQVVDRLGACFPDEAGVGVRALLTGASGTGKTLSARVLGAQLGLDVYRVDLAAVIDKYIGETEKNLHRILSTAEELDVLLLIDEGDSLLGRRTEVRSSNDRFANLETNYLLQRLESYRGIVVVTTNAADSIDPAFQRRMDVVVPFVAPTARQRLEIWQLHLPPDHRVPLDHLTDLALRCDMTGGQIRNAVMHAAVQSMGDADAVEARHLEQAVASEYYKAGATSPFDPSGRRRRLSEARAFQELLR